MKKAGVGFAQAIQNTGQGSVHVEERADKGQSFYVNSGSGALEQKSPQCFSKDEEKQSAACTQQKTVPAGAACHIVDSFLYPSAWSSATDGMSITEAELVTVEGNRIRGSAIPVNTPYIASDSSLPRPKS